MRLLAFAVFIALVAPATARAQDQILVTAEWLAARLTDPDLVVFHVGSRATYDAGHVPGARFLSPLTELAHPNAPDGLRLELPPTERLDSVLGAKGVSIRSRVVLYWSDGLYTPTSRAFYTMEYAGLSGRVHLLDGGLEAWRRGGRPLSTQEPEPAPATFRSVPRSDLVVNADWVRGRLNRPGVAVLDARAPEFYHGAETRQERIGHVPGAANVPFTTVVDQRGWFSDQATLRTLFAGAGAAPGDTVATYCHIGQQASLVWLAARIAGHPAVLYDGSFQDWSARRDLPVVAPAASTRDSLLVDAEWLRANLDRRDLVVVHAARTRAPYDSAHILGARFAAVSEFAVTRDGIPMELPPVEELVALVRRLGIGNGSRVVLYGDPLAAARLFFTLDYLGHGDRTAMLDGGLDAWRASGGPVATAPAHTDAGVFQPRAWQGVVVDADWVRDRIGDPAAALIDARSPEEFRGERADSTLPRLGHIPGSTNLDWRTLLVEGRFRPAGELRPMLEAAGAGPRSEVITICGSGYRASVLYFVARYLGYRTRMYDGSFSEWSRRMDLPVAR